MVASVRVAKAAMRCRPRVQTCAVDGVRPFGRGPSQAMKAIQASL
jgi:hypothetical protein